jgi:hypothetical protein
MRILADGALQMEEQKLRCADADLKLDRRLPNLGAAAPGEGTLWINPRLLAAETPTVRLFVFHHECGHLHVGASELESDCWAVERGVDAGWLDSGGLKEVCESFGDAPESSTHPSGRRRCANLDRCFATASAKKRQQTPVKIAKAEPRSAGAPVAAAKAAAASGASAPPRTAAPVRAEEAVATRAEPASSPAAALQTSAPQTSTTRVASAAPQLATRPRLLWTGETETEQ